MPYVNTGLPNAGFTDFFVFQYDQALSADRGRDLAKDLMKYCDDDFAQLMLWFSGRGLDMSPPIHVSLDSVTTDKNGFVTQDSGAEWKGLLTDVLHVEVYIGDANMSVGTPTMLARCLLVTEVSEMFMRNMALPHNNPWFTPTNEGNKGEALSVFLAANFFRQAYPNAPALPQLAHTQATVTDLWLNSPRDNFLEVDDGDLGPNAKTGCGTLFLSYLHDHLGYSIEDIISAGAGKLSSVYANLTGEGWENAWLSFSQLVDSRYPHTIRKATKPGHEDTFSPSYSPPLETVFPVADLHYLDVPEVLSWVVNARPNVGRAFLSHQLPVEVDIKFSSDDHSLISVPEKVVTKYIGRFPLTVAKHSPGKVTVTASYGDGKMSAEVRVVAPEDLPVPPLAIVPTETDSDPCALGFLAGSLQDFVVTNPSVIADHKGLTFHWDVANAAAKDSRAETLTITKLPDAGTKVTIQVSLRNYYGIHAEGSYEFTTTAPQSGLKEELRKLNCRLEHLKEINVQIPPNVPVEVVTIRGDLEPLTVIEAHALEVVAVAERLLVSVKETRRLAASSRSETAAKQAETAEQPGGLTPTGRRL